VRGYCQYFVPKGTFNPSLAASIPDYPFSEIHFPAYCSPLCAFEAIIYSIYRALDCQKSTEKTGKRIILTIE
jgi:hypothetical protein